MDWVIQVIKIRRSLTRQELEHSVMEGLRVSLECGTTSIGEIVSDRALIPLYGGTAISGRLCLEAIGQDPARNGALLADIEKTIATFSGGTLRPALSPHAPHTLSADFFRSLAEVAARFAIPMRYPSFRIA